MKIQSFKDLKVWQVSMELTEEIYKVKNKLPASENFGLTSQMTRAVISIPLNIAEGFGRNSLASFVNHLRIANGSLYELQTILELNVRLDYINDEILKTALELSNKTELLLKALIKSINYKIVENKNKK